MDFAATRWRSPGKSTGWHNRSYCVTREGLLRCIREYCGEVDIAALATIEALPRWHPDRATD